MKRNENWTCAAVRRLGRKLMQERRQQLDVDLFRHSLPDPMPRDMCNIFDRILQLILLLLEELKPDEDEDEDNGETSFPKLAGQAESLARRLVPANILTLTVEKFTASIDITVANYRSQPPATLRLAREGIRMAGHVALGPLAEKWSAWNEDIREILDDEATNHVLATLPDYLDAWTQIAKGLREIK